MPRFNTDAHDQIVWVLNETTGVYNNTGSLGNTTAYQPVITNNIKRDAVGVFSTAPWIPGISNIPVGASATNNSIAGASTFNPQPPFTVSFWFNLREINVNGFRTHLIFKEYRNAQLSTVWGTGAPDSSLEISLPGGSNNIYVSLTTSPSSTVNFTITDFPLPIGRWTHIGLTHDGMNVRVYMNGCILPYYNTTQVFATPVGAISYTNGTDGYGNWVIGCPAAANQKEEACYTIQDLRIANVARNLQYFQDIFQRGMLSFGTVTETIYYKLQAIDTGNGDDIKVTWVDTEVSLDNAPTPPNGGPYENLTVLDSWMQ